MVAILGLLYLLTLITQVNTDVINCTPSSSPVKITELNYYPRNPVIGGYIYLNINATLNRTITDAPGKIAVQMYYHNQWKNFSPIYFNLCDLFRCPIIPAVYTYNNRFTIPPIPATIFYGQLRVLDRGSDQQLVCITFYLNF